MTGGTISPNGRLIAFVARNDRGLMAIWVRSLDSIEARPLAGTEARQIGRPFFWSPDSRFIGYVGGDGRLKKVDVSGGPPQTIVTLEAPSRTGFSLVATDYRHDELAGDPEEMSILSSASAIETPVCRACCLIRSSVEQRDRSFASAMPARRSSRVAVRRSTMSSTSRSVNVVLRSR